MTRAVALFLVGLLPVARAAATQRPVDGRDTVRLRDLHAAARQADPRQRQIGLYRAIAERRLRNLAAERLPSLSTEGMAQYQSVVTEIPTAVPGAVPPQLPHDTYDARLLAQQRLYDPSLAPRRGVEQAQLAEAEAQVDVGTYALRVDVDEAFFSAALMQARGDELDAVIADLEAQLRVAQSRVREGTALPSEAALLQAELLRRRQDQQELAAGRRAALAVLSTLTGRTIGLNDSLALPDLAQAVLAARGAAERARPEYERFVRTRERLAAQSIALDAQTKPRVVAYARAGYGKPGLDFLNTGFQSYWLAGVQVQWAPWNWNVTARDREALALQQDIVAADEAAFAAANQRAVERQLADAGRLEVALRSDEEIIALRERIERETRRRFEEAVVTAAEYVDRRNDVLAARMARATHEVELAQARARYLTTIGVELR
jgi:outer membrane protein TolC